MTPETIEPVKLFYSYSHRDEELRDKLEKHLTILHRQNIISSWHDRKIASGSDWAEAIDSHLRSADVILLLISPDFLASDYCYDKEMKLALVRHNAGESRVIPVVLRPADWKGAEFGKLQALPKDAKPVVRWESQDEAFTNIAQGIRETVAEITKSGRKTIIRKINEIQTPLSPSDFVEVIDSLHSHNQFKENKIEISLRKKDGSIVSGIYTGQRSCSAEEGYRYNLRTDIGASQIVKIIELNSVLKFDVVKR